MKSEYQWNGGSGSWGSETYYDLFGVDRDGEELLGHLRPLLRRLNQYGKLLQRLKTEGGKVRDLRQLTQLLATPIKLRGRFGGDKRVPLTEPQAVRSYLSSVHHGLRFEIRTAKHGFPLYYLARTSSDYFGTYSLILEDYYRSPGYEEHDPDWERFSCTTRFGEAERLLRLSPYRMWAEDRAAHEAEEPPAVEADEADDDNKSAFGYGSFGYGRSSYRDELTADRLLYTVGRYVLDAAWHEDQRFAGGVAELLHMTAFRETMELLALCLGANLSSLRSVAMSKRGEAATAFFASAYRNKPIHTLLQALPEVEGPALVQFRERARTLYPKLATSFGKLMRFEGGLSCFQSSQPVYRSFIANYRRLGLLGFHLTDEFLDACAVLEEQSRQISEAVLEATVNPN